MNTLAFLQALTREQATVFVPSDTGARALGGSSVDDIVQGLNTYYDKLSLGNFFSERTYPITSVGELQTFFIMLCHNVDGLLKHDECTYARLNRPAGVADHTLVFSKYQDPGEVDVFHILTVDPQLQLLWDLPSNEIPQKLEALLRLWHGQSYESISLLFTSSGPEQGPALGAGPAYVGSAAVVKATADDLAANPLTPLDIQQARARIDSAAGTTPAAGGTPVSTFSALATAAYAHPENDDQPVPEQPPPLLPDAVNRDPGGTAPGSGGSGHKSSYSSRKRIRKKKRSKKKSRKKKRSKKKSKKKKRSKKKRSKGK